MSTVATAPRLCRAPQARARRAPAPQPAATPAPAGFVGHTDLVRRLAKSSAGRIVVIVAPAGYGKSALLSAWAARDDREFVWQASADPRPDGHAARVTVLDDAQRLTPERLRRTVDQARHDLDAGSTLALASRTEPALGLARLRAGRALIEIRGDDLTITPADAATLLRRAGLRLGLDAVRTLVRRTEGWPAALYLAALAGRENPRAASGPDAVRGDDQLLADYLREEVLATLDPRLLEFASRTSVLPELSAGLCDAVLKCRGSGLVLRELEHASPLLRALDPAHERYRWHGLIRDVLRAELRRSEPTAAPTLHRRASRWYEEWGDAERAIDHAVEARDGALSGGLLFKAAVGYIAQGRNDVVQGWLARFPREHIARHPSLALAAAYSFMAAGKPQDARHCTVALSPPREPGAEMTGATPLDGARAGLEAMVAADGPEAMVRAATRACELTPADSPWRAIHLFAHGVALHLSGDPAAGEPKLHQGAGLSAAAAPLVASICWAQAAMIAVERRDWVAAADLTDRARQLIDEHGLTGEPLGALAFAAAAAARAHDGRCDEAKHDLRRGIELLATLGDLIPWYGAEARVLLAHASLGLADVVGARTLLAEASRLARRMRGAVILGRWFDDAWAAMDALAETRLAGPSSLTIAELRILRFLPSHRSFKEIAAQLGVSTNTVKTQAHAVYRKLGAASRSEAVAHAADAGLLGQ